MIHDYLLALRFYLVFTLFAAVGLAVTQRLFGHRLLAYMLAKPVGLLLFAYPLWLLSSLHLAATNNTAILMTWFVIAAAASLFLLPAPRRLPAGLIAFEAICLGVYMLYLYMRAMHPEINGTEKFMDMAMLTSAGKTDYFPFTDPWWGAKPVNYYYYGYYLLSLIAKLAAVPYSLAFNFSLGVLYIGAATGVAALILLLTGSRTIAVAGAFAATTAGTVAYGARVIYGWATGTAIPSYASSARYYDPSYIINEIPSYSFTVCDLHPHLISLPFFLANLIVLWRLASEAAPRAGLIALFCLGWASSALINSWDAITLGALFGVILLYKLPWRAAFLYAAAAAAVTGLLCAPFLVNFHSPAAGIGFAPVYAWANDLIGRQYPTPPALWLGIWGAYMLPLVAAYWRKRNPGDPDQPFQASLWLVGTGLVIAVELFFFRDIYHIANPPYFRANTVFKFGFHCWVMLTIAFAAETSTLLGRRARIAVWSVLTLIGAIYPLEALRQFYQITPRKLFSPANATLDGAAFLKHEAPDDYEVIQWINRTQQQRRILVEAAGDSYSFYGRISAFTGMPNPINWKSHEWGWRFHLPLPSAPRETGYGPVAAVGSEVARVYESASVEQTRALLSKFRAHFVYIGETERSAYPRLQEAKFDALGHVVSSAGRSKLYELE